MKVYPVAGSAIPFQRDGEGNSFATFDGSPTGLVKRVSGASELTGKGVRRVVIKAEVPYVTSVDANGSKVYATVSAHLVVNIPEKSGLQISGANVPAGMAVSDATAAAIQLISTVVTDKSVAMTASEVQNLSNAICRGSNGMNPIDPDADYGKVST